MNTNIDRAGPEAYRELSRQPEWTPRAIHILAVSGALAAITFTLVYLTTLSFASGY